MPTNQQSSCTQPTSASKSPLVRSKSLRLPSSKPKTEQSSSNLTRHGSIRQPRCQSSVSPGLHSKPPMSALRKPPVKPKPVFSSKSIENLASARNLHNVDREHEAKKQFSITRSPTKNNEGGHSLAKGVTFSHDNFTPSDSPSSLHSERSSGQLLRDTSCSSPDLVVHLKRLTEEHEKLQVEYARIRIQLLDLLPLHPATSLKREFQHLSQSDSHLSSIPENSSGSGVENSENSIQNQEILIQAYKSEILHLQDENRKLQRKYWEQISNSEPVNDDSKEEASQQIVELIDKLDDKQRELIRSNNQIQELESQVSSLTFDLQQCQDALQDYQRMLEESNAQKEKLEIKLKEYLVKMNDYKENIEFLQEERCSIAEALQDAENSLNQLELIKKNSDKRINEILRRARKLYEKVLDKNLQNQLLQAELDRNEGLARDMLLSQGAELTMAAMHLSEITINLHNLLNYTSDFAANYLDLQKEVLEEITSDLDSDCDKNSDLSPLDVDSELLFKLPSNEDNSNKILPQLTTLPDIHKSMPDLPSSDSSAIPSHSVLTNDTEPSLSIVQSILKETEKNSSKNNSVKKSSLTDLFVVKNTSNATINSACTSDNVSSSENNISKIAFKGSSAFKPVGTAIPFRPVTQPLREPSPPTVLPSTDTWNSDEDKKKASLEGQRNQLNTLLVKLKKVIELTHGKHLSTVQALKNENSQLQEELKLCKKKGGTLKTEYKLKLQEIESLKSKLSVSSDEMKKLKAIHVDEKEELLKQIADLKLQNKCLEAVNEEQLRQLREEVQKSADSGLLKQNTAYLSDAIAICDKLSLKQEVVRLKEVISQKENLLQMLAQKFSKTKKILEDNLQKADNEVECLDGVIQNIYECLQKHPELVESSDILKSIFSVVSGSISPESLKHVLNDSNEVVEN